MHKELNATLQFDNTERDSDVLDDNEQNNANINYQDILANRGNLNASHKKSYLMLLAKSLKTEHKVNKCSADKIAVSSRHLMLNILSTTLEKIIKILPNYGLDQTDMTNILENLNNHMQSDLLLSNDIFLNMYS